MLDKPASEEKALTVSKQIAIAPILPTEIVKLATEQANALMDIVEKKKLYVTIEKKKYMFVEGWEVIGAFNRVYSITDEIYPILNPDNEVVGYEARVSLWKDGNQIGGAIMPCGLDEFPCRGKEGEAKHKACKSAAQTWAASKAYRMNYSWVAVLAGYQPTPAEEMITELPVKSQKSTNDISEPVETSGLAGFATICPEHGDAWQEGKWGKYHKMPKGYCSFKNIIQPIANKLFKEKLNFDTTAAAGEWLKENYGNTWSQIDQDAQLAILITLENSQDK